MKVLYNKTFTTAFLALLILCMPFSDKIWGNQSFAIQHACAIVGLVLACTIIAQKKQINVSLLDVFILGSAFFCMKGNFSLDNFLYSVLFLTIYYLAKYALNNKYSLVTIALTIVFSGLIQCCIIFLQYFNVLHSGNHFFKLTGSFSNPGPLGGYLSLSFLIAVSLIFHLKEEKKISCILDFGIVLLIIGLLLSDSRSAWLGGSVGLLVALSLHFNWPRKMITLSIISVVSCFLLFSFCFYKQESATGRLDIWRVCGEMIKEKPFWGHGVNYVAENYMHYQAQFTKEHPDSVKRLSTNNEYAFNEYIRMWCEQGIIGLFLIGTIIAIILRFGKKEYSFLHWWDSVFLHFFLIHRRSTLCFYYCLY